MSKNSIYLLLTVFFLNFANESIIMGLIVWSSTFSDLPIKQTAVVVAVLVAAIVAAVLLKDKKQFANLKVNSAILLAFSLLLFLAPAMTFLWYLSVIGRTFIGQLLISQLMAMLPLTAATDELPLASKRMQIAYTGAAGAAYGLSPLIVSLGFKGTLHILDVVMLAFVFIFCTVSLASRRTQATNAEGGSRAKVSFVKLLSRVRFLTPFLFLMWISYGVFFVVEVPLLKSKINASSYLVSLFLVSNFIFNLATTNLVSEKVYNAYASKSFSISAILICFFSALYLYTSNVVVLYLCVAVLGVFNGILNLSLNTQIHKLDNIYMREASFLWYRVVVEVGILGGAVLCYVLASAVDIYFSLSIACVVIGLLLILIRSLARSDLIQSELKSS